MNNTCLLGLKPICDNCGECDDRCELDPNKICDNCFKCIDNTEQEYAEIPIEAVYFEDDYIPESIPFDDRILRTEDPLPIRFRTLKGMHGIRMLRYDF